eukprot:8515-Pelagomonas_calceolata.AAC.1
MHVICPGCAPPCTLPASPLPPSLTTQEGSRSPQKASAVVFEPKMCHSRAPPANLVRIHIPG